MNLQLNTTTTALDAEITISGSKSESNRLLILQQLYPNLHIENLSDSDDTHHLQDALSSKKEIADIGHAGTAMRFLTAFFASQQGVTKILQGSDRMHNRPIEILVDALRSLGADITYLKKEGYPPLKIVGKELTKNTVSINGNVSSQYISALMLIAPSLKNGLSIELVGKITSVPYINMTLSLLHQLEIEASFSGQNINISPKTATNNQTIVVESDWSSASYFYSLVALSDHSEITISTFFKKSIQGDSRVENIYRKFGVETSFRDNKIHLKKNNIKLPDIISINLEDNPDLAQTIIVTCLGLGVDCNLKGLHTLKIKETDRLMALKKEIQKFDVDRVEVSDQSITLKNNSKLKSGITIDTYNDHRMAMSFAPLSLINPLIINNPEVVSKSYSNFWNDLKSVGFNISEK